MRNTQAKNDTYHNLNKLMPSMYSDDEDYKGFLDIKNRLEHEFMDDIPENAKHNQKIGILSYVVRINEIIYHNFRDTEYYVNMYPHKLDEYDGNLNVLLKTIEEYYKSVLPGYNPQKNYVNRPYYPYREPRVNNSYQSPDVLMQKLNYVISLLEDQQDEKTNNVTEEVILYSFLGIFIIFMADTFVKAGKYTR